MDQNPHAPSTEIDLISWAKILWKGKLAVISITLGLVLLTSIYLWQLPNVYRSHALVAASKDGGSSQITRLVGQLGGLASITGMNLGSGQSDVMLAIEVLRSRSFISTFISEHNLLIPLMAAEGWNSKKDSLLLDSDIYDIQTQQWKLNGNTGKKPTEFQAYKKFRDSLDVDYDQTTGFVTISVDHVSPQLARDWVELLITDINRHLRNKDQAQLEERIKYLKIELENTSVATMQQMFYGLIEQQLQQLMLAKVNKEYVFTVIDGPMIPEEKHRPKRLLITFLALIFSIVLGISVVTIAEYAKNLSR